MWFHRKMVLKTANGGDVGHCCQKNIFFKCSGGHGKKPIQLTFQVTDGWIHSREGQNFLRRRRAARS